MEPGSLEWELECAQSDLNIAEQEYQKAQRLADMFSEQWMDAWERVRRAQADLSERQSRSVPSDPPDQTS